MVYPNHSVHVMSSRTVVSGIHLLVAECSMWLFEYVEIGENRMTQRDRARWAQPADPAHVDVPAFRLLGRGVF